MIAFSKHLQREEEKRRKGEEGGALAGAAGGPLPIRENSCPFVVQFKVPVLEPGHGEFLNHEFARINTNGEGSVLWMIKGQANGHLPPARRPR